jgi:hypothetical protein
MTATSKKAPGLKALAKQMLLATGRFKQAYAEEQKGLAPLDDESGWAVLDHFVALAKERKDRDSCVSDAARELFRLQLVGQSQYSLTGLRQFVNWYVGLYDRLYARCRDFFEYEGDSLNDLQDGFPLAGAGLTRRALYRGFTSLLAMKRAVTHVHGAKWAAFVVDGENYVQSALENAAYEYYLHSLAEAAKLTGRESELVAWAHRYERD